MYELEKTDEVTKLIAITKSNSGISGPLLAKAHIRLGELLAENMSFTPEDTTVIAVLRGGIFFAQGIYFKLGCRFEVYNPKTDVFVLPETKNVIIVDSVINTGETIDKILTPNMFVASCVINEKAVSKYENNLFTVRVSSNAYVGCNIKQQSGALGPDTTMRLFNQL